MAHCARISQSMRCPEKLKSGKPAQNTGWKGGLQTARKRKGRLPRKLNCSGAYRQSINVSETDTKQVCLQNPLLVDMK